MVYSDLGLNFYNLIVSYIGPVPQGLEFIYIFGTFLLVCCLPIFCCAMIKWVLHR